MLGRNITVLSVDPENNTSTFLCFKPNNAQHNLYIGHIKDKHFVPLKKIVSQTRKRKSVQNIRDLFQKKAAHTTQREDTREVIGENQDGISQSADEIQDVISQSVDQNQEGISQSVDEDQIVSNIADNEEVIQNSSSQILDEVIDRNPQQSRMQAGSSSLDIAISFRIHHSLMRLNTT